MDSAEVGVLIGGVACIAFTLWFFFGGRTAGRTRAAEDEGTTIYACPMHPWITSTDPAADCSICGMKLVQQN
jgi:hypothetical protein